MTTRMMQRRGLASQWQAINPILEIGEFGFESDNQKFKVGDGETAWAGLPYYISELDLPDVVALLAAASENVQTAIATSVSTAVAGIVDSAPSVMNTLNEISLALADDPNFASTMTTALANKADTDHAHVKADITDFSHTHLKADISDFAHTHLKADITDFAHTHDASEITNTLNQITATTYTLQSSDNGKLLVLNPTGGSITVTVNNVFTVGQRADIYLRGTGVTFTAGTGTIEGVGTTMANQYTVASILCVASGVYAILGSVE